MLLAIDVGNTNTVVGAFDGDELVGDWRLATNANSMPDEYAALLSTLLAFRKLSLSHLDAAILSSVVPRMTTTLRELIGEYLGIAPLVVGPEINVGLKVGIENPKEVGADRLVNSLAALRLYGGPAIVADLGTTTNFDAVSADGVYLGGAIAPGILTSLEALALFTARLPRIEMVRPERAIGKNTLAAIQAGVILGHASMVEGMLRRLVAEMEGSPIAIATGGLCEVMAAEVPAIKVADKNLTLKGLRIMYELNRK